MKFNQRFHLSKLIIFKILSKLSYGNIKIVTNNQQHDFKGSINQEIGAVTVRVHDEKFFSSLLLSGTNGAAESYINGYWETDDLATLIQIILVNEQVMRRMDSKLILFIQNVANLFAFLRKNNIKNAKQNILSHYDLGNEFFKLFLDKKMMYSCALYENVHTDLETAGTHKLRTICDALALKPEDHILEIGSGWGGLCFFAAQEYGCKVTTTTISNQQYNYLQAEVSRLGLEHQITLLNQDYRELEGQYDKVVSVEMIEAVGAKYFEAFFTKCNSLVKPGGLFFLQAITINNEMYVSAKNNVDFIKKYIFPGGCLPSIQVINNSIENFTDMHLVKYTEIGKHYVRTLSDWMARFHQSKDKIRALKFSEQFIRTWDFYFCYCIAGFREDYLSDIHALWQKRDISHA